MKRIICSLALSVIAITLVCLPVKAACYNTNNLELHLLVDYGLLKTPAGYAGLSFDVIPGIPGAQCDYWVRATIMKRFYGKLQSESLTDEGKRETCEILRRHMERIAMDIINLLPGERIMGCYWRPMEKPKYFETYCNWSNYDHGGILNDFQWQVYADDKLY